MCDSFPSGRLSVIPPLDPARRARLTWVQDGAWVPCPHGCCLLPDGRPDPVELRRLVLDLGTRHQVRGLVVWDEGDVLMGLLVADGVVSETVLWRHAVPCSAVVPGPWPLPEAG